MLDYALTYTGITSLGFPFLIVTTGGSNLIRADGSPKSVSYTHLAGEAIDMVKKWMAQGHELDKEHFKSELGDIAWYLAGAATAIDIYLEEVFQANIDKLKKRYPKGFDAEKSLVRLKGDI